MDIKKLITVVTMIIAILAIGTFVFIRSLFRETAPISYPIQIEEVGPSVEEPSLSYAIPTNTIPTLQDIEDNIKKAEEKRTTSEALRAEIESEKLKRRARGEIIQQEKPVTETAEEKSNEKTVIIPERKEVAFPTREEVERMRSQGIITY